jgi:hypothetical protein
MVEEAEKTNSKTLAYFAGPLVAKKNIFMIMMPNVIKMFMIVILKFSSSLLMVLQSKLKSLNLPFQPCLP